MAFANFSFVVYAKTATQLTLLLSPELLFLFIEVSVGETSAKYLYSGWFLSDSRKFQWDNNRTETSKYKETSFYSEFGKDILQKTIKKIHFNSGCDLYNFLLKVTLTQAQFRKRIEGKSKGPPLARVALRISNSFFLLLIFAKLMQPTRNTP